ncbi:hypothetical protein EST38_g5889 [Candolleomyces aberdarensis]|uniref:Protein kinase domain-containing protein n=1 Tax=Candolleomyces aberdarensis TaxID=2316362 RepID=A0A4Q2DJF8_9AGAR|nr:hypothetical protein EST38_g5889 [Candolleomyces aberdarensis]
MLIEAQSIELADAATEARTSDFLENPTAECRPHERGFLFVPQGTKPGPCPPAVFFMHGARPPKTTTEEAHLYLTPNQLCGTGNHSVVYNAEWEVPRSLIVEDVICKKCVFEKGIEILVAEDGPNGDTKDPKWLQETGTVVETAHEDPGLTIANKDAIEDENGECVSYDIEPPSLKVSRKYNGPVRVIDTGVQWQRAADGNTCKHRTGEPGQPLSPSEPPLTARVSIVAKMSLGYDYHLKTEANVYQKFPDHFYQHFTGYNIIAPLQDPVPVWALVPQFYGYYLPDKTIPPSFWKKGNRDGKGQNKGADDGEEKDGTSEKADRLKYDYRSPLMLIEHCGETVCNILDSMSIDDRQHCASLFLRLHHEGWLHNSLYTRNILYQPGPVDASPMERAQKATKRSDLRKTSFRLIDFGRTEKIQDRSLRLWEEDVATKTFKVLHDAMD